MNEFIKIIKEKYNYEGHPIHIKCIDGFVIGLQLSNEKYSEIVDKSNIDTKLEIYTTEIVSELRENLEQIGDDEYSYMYSEVTVEDIIKLINGHNGIEWDK